MTDKKTFDLSSIIGQVSKLDTASAAAVALPIDEVHPNEHNFYDVSSVDSLVDSILLDGLQSPLVVSQRTEDDYVIISGHRRFAALQKICEGGLRIPEGKLFAADINASKVPCLVNRYGSELEAELALIRANSDTRVLSSAEISRQAERVEMLLYELKGQGYEFPGKMRDYVAQACQVSASKLARLKVIREKLIVPYLKEFEAGHPGAINESVAYELAQLSEDDQHWIYSTGRSLCTGSAKRYENEIRCLKKAKCEGGNPCRQAQNRFVYHNRPNCYDHMPCAYDSKCCRDCFNIATCKMVCPECEELVKDKKAAERAAKKEENAKIKVEDNRHKEYCRRLFDRLHLAMTAADVSEKETCAAAGWYYYEGKLNVPDKITGSSFPISRDCLIQLSSLADKLGCSTDFLICRTDIREPTDVIVKKVDAECASSVPGTWRKDTDYTDGMMVAKIVLGEGKLMTSIIYHNKYGFSFAESGKTLKVNVAAWYPVPEYKGDGSDG